MYIYKFGNFETEIDTSDCEFMENFEEKALKLAEDTDKTQKTGRRSEVIKRMCALAFRYFDDLFGEGTSELMFGGKLNMRLCDRAMFELASAISEDEKLYAAEVKEGLAKSTGNRAQRRAKKK